MNYLVVTIAIAEKEIEKLEEKVNRQALEIN